ncbi:hypothetical protein C9439_03355 [archaeon SCG-AAA382B04]|nr:hypothetical protein C9439_03355 [archaeon SCG-AAA382B04]
MKNKAGKERGLVKKLRRWFRPRFREKIGKTNYWRLRNLFGLKPRNPFEEAWRKDDSGEIKKHYRHNLEIVLESVENLVREVDGKIIITADHGEGFGRDDLWGHPRGKNYDFLRTVPWLVIE